MLRRSSRPQAKPDPLSAAEIYVLRFQAPGPLIEPCLRVNWWDHLFFHNTTNENKTVRLLGVSDGSISLSAQDLLVPAGRTRDVSGTAQGWIPDGQAYPIWANRLDLPDGVVATSRLEVRASFGPAPCPISSSITILGALPLPFFKELAPASSAQYHLATDLGRDIVGLSADARISVGIYNAGTAPGNAEIEIRRSCDDRIIDFRSLVVPANSVVQSVGLSTDTGGDCSVSSGNPPPYSSYAVVRIDQPSFSYAITASNEIPPKIPVGVSFTR